MVIVGDNVIIDRPALVHDTATIQGKVHVRPDASIWANVFIRSTRRAIEIGSRSNIQEAATIHNVSDVVTRIGRDTSITVGATLQGCMIGDRCLIGNFSTVLEGARIGNNSIVAGGSVVSEGSEFPANSVIAGIPARRVRTRNNARANLIFARFYFVSGRNLSRGIEKMSDADLKFVMSEP